MKTWKEVSLQTKHEIATWAFVIVGLGALLPAIWVGVHMGLDALGTTANAIVWLGKLVHEAAVTYSRLRG